MRPKDADALWDIKRQVPAGASFVIAIQVAGVLDKGCFAVRGKAIKEIAKVLVFDLSFEPQTGARFRGKAFDKPEESCTMERIELI